MQRFGRRFRALFDACPAAFGAVTRLTLENMELAGAGDFHDILAACARLEALALYACDACGTTWRVRHARLAELTITFCSFGHVDLAWLPRLQRFAYVDWASMAAQPVCFSHVPCLATVTLSNGQTVGKQIGRLSKTLANTAVNDLRLNFKGHDIWMEPEDPKRFIEVFSNLKHIKIRNVHEECGLSWIMFLIQAAPLLKDLYIKLWDYECEEEDEYSEYTFPTKRTHVQWELAAGFKHYGLTRVIIFGLHNNRGGVVAFLRRLMEAAVNLQEIQMCKNMPCKECGAMGTGFPHTDQEKDIFRQSIFGGEPVPSCNISIQP